MERAYQYTPAEYTTPKLTLVEPAQRVETPAPVELLQKETSIFDYYNVNYEADFIKSHPELSKEQQEYYIRENALTFLCEFAGKVPFKKLTYIQRGDGFYYGNMKIMDVYKKTAAMPEATIREEAEAVGLEQIEEGFQRPTKRLSEAATSAIWISPPKIADYGFVFYFQKEDAHNETLQGKKVTEYILRYKEKMGEVTQSQAIEQSVAGDSIRLIKNTPEQFLRNPTLRRSNSPRDELQNVLKSTGITQEQINQSEQFENETQRQLGPWINRYIQTIFTLASYNTSHPEYSQMKTEAERILSSLFNGAKDIHTQIVEKRSSPSQDDTSPKSLIAQYYAADLSATTTGGSCPIVKSGGEDPITTAGQMFELLERGIPLEKALPEGMESDYWDDYPCPSCNEPVPGEKKGSDPSTWLTTCPHCKEEIKGCKPNELKKAA